MLKKAFLLVSLAGVLLFAPTADASGFRKTNCTISGIEYDNARIMLSCTNDPITYYGFGGGQACAVNLDTLKIWMSMLQSQFLAGRTIEMYVNDAATCAGNNVIGSVKMMP